MEEVKKPKAALGIRHVQCVMLFFAMLLAFGMRVNMSMAIVAMTDSTMENTFDWSMQIQSVILSSFFWGYVVLQVPGGLLADKVGGSLLISISIGANSIISLILPTAAVYGGWYAVCACRVLQGLAQGFVYPSMHNLIGKWVPLEEKSRLGTFIYAGAQLGTAVMLMSAGFLADYWGWSAIFYFIGTCGVVWTVIYFFIGAGEPQDSKLISEEEKLYIQTSLGQVGGKKTLPVPWLSILTSMPFISLIIVHCCQNWGFWTLMTEMPSYMSQVLGVNIKANGVLSATPYVVMYILSFPAGFISDYALGKGWVSTTAARKISNSIGYVGPAIALIGLAYVPAGNVGLAVGILSAVVGLNAGHFTGFMLVHLDMAPNFAGTMLGITNAIANCISIIAPLAAGAIIKDETDATEWRKIFYLASFIYIIGNTIFLIFGTSIRQAWNEPKTEKNIENNNDADKTEKVV
ncbi:putative inorganic phosphate cotransporter isoform X2 [Leguminivora glycinivorella]|uniref:putative inorganic phosphate cotransporter isoform X2 n=1 Tax=Leguminivora glycinivorella TaxID=1035111 RepID=UPI002010B8D6|nr:putative inorganic phosphate cotransporter isoform X2 [Leguminivora glycinivorella]